jgi:hypothetical protein
LIAMKLLSVDADRRPTDSADLVHLAAVATDEDWEVVTATCRLISERGFNRGRDLASAMKSLRARVVEP